MDDTMPPSDAEWRELYSAADAFKALLACNSSGFILCTGIINPWELERELPKQLLGTLEKTPSFPSAIHVKSPELRNALSPILSKLGIPVVLEESLPALEEAMESLFDGIGRF